MTFKIGDQVKCLRVSPELNLDGTTNDNCRCIVGQVYDIDNAVHSALCGDLISISGELHAAINFELCVPKYYRYYKPINTWSIGGFKFILRQGHIGFWDGDSTQNFEWNDTHDRYVQIGSWIEISKEDTIERKYERIFVEPSGRLFTNNYDPDNVAKLHKELKFDSKGFYFV